VSKNDNIVRVWTNSESTPAVEHWYWDSDMWHYCASGAVSYHEVFCLNDKDHTPAPWVRTSSLEGLV
jgi:hypothetical protein